MRLPLTLKPADGIWSCYNVPCVELLSFSLLVACGRHLTILDEIWVKKSGVCADPKDVWPPVAMA